MTASTKTSWRDLEGGLCKATKRVVFVEQEVRKGGPCKTSKRSRALTRLYQGRSRSSQERYTALSDRSGPPRECSHRTSSECPRGLIRAVQDLLGVSTWLHWSRPGPPRSTYVASSEPSRTSSGAAMWLHHDRSRHPQRRSRGLFRSRHVASLWPFRTSLEHLRGLIKAVQDLLGALTWLHRSRPGPPQGRPRGFIRAVQDLFRARTWLHQERPGPPQEWPRGFIVSVQDLLRGARAASSEAATWLHRDRSGPP